MKTIEGTLRIKGLLISVCVAIVVFACSKAIAKPVAKNEAERAAETFIVQSYRSAGKDVQTVTAFGKSRRAINRVRPFESKGRQLGFVADLKPGGYLLLSADDEIPAVKLHAEEGSFDQLPPEFIRVLESEMHEDQVALAELHKVNRGSDPQHGKLWAALKNPQQNRQVLETLPAFADGQETQLSIPSGTYLLTTTWDQGDPYNYYCPSATGGPGGKAYAGCTAAALSQILRYSSLPSAALQNSTYTDNKGDSQGTYSLSGAGLTPYDWGNMPNAITPSSSVAQKQAVGQLVYHAAVALASDFEKNGTGAYPSAVPGVLRSVFGYSCGPYEDKSSYTSSGWYNKIAANISAGKPIFYAIWQSDYSGGHAVVCDGYQGGNQIHLNLGWSGAFNAWYNMDSVSASGYTWTIHGAVQGITPPGNTPVNDQCAGAVTLANGIAVTASTSAATSQGDIAPSCGSSVGKGLWYKVTPSVSGTVTLTTCGSDFDTVLAVYSGVCGSFTGTLCNDDSSCGSAISFTATANNTYYIYAGGYGGASGTLQISASWTVDAPSNDFCSGAISIGNGVTKTVNTATATTTADGAPVCGYNVGKGVWYKITPNVTGIATINTCGSSFDTVLAAYGGTCGAFIDTLCNDDDSSCGSGNSSASKVSFYCTAGVTYYLFAGGYNGASGDLQINASWYVIERPANDACSGAIALASGQTITLNTSTATSDGDPTPACRTSFGKGVWYTFSPAVNGTVNISTCLSDFDTALQVYTGNCGSLVPLSFGCNDDNGASCSTTRASVSFEGTAGTTYRILVGGYGGSSGTLKISATVTGKPIAPVVLEPTAVTSRTFAANWNPVEGATSYRLDVSTSSSFTTFVSGYQNLNVGNVTSRLVTALIPGGTYHYRVRAFNAQGASGNSGIMSITILPPAGPTHSDFNNDGLPDVLLQRTDGVIAAWSLNGSNLLGSVLLRNGTPPNNLRVFGAGDFNGDGKTDVALQNITDGRLVVWYMNGPAFLGAAFLNNGIAPELAWRAVSVADFNNDDKPDILFQNRDLRSSVWLMNNTNFIDSVVLRNGAAAGAGWRIAGAGDFSGDGETDIVWQHLDGRIALWRFNATTYSNAGLLPIGPAASTGNRIRGVADFNLDGKPDLLWHNATTGKTAMWFFNGEALINSAQVSPLGFQWQIVGPK